MSAPITMILSGGGLRSLVATALALSPSEGARVMLLHLRDQRPAAPERQAYVRKLALHYKIALLEVEGLRPVAPAPAALSGDLRQLHLLRMQMLTMGLVNALEYGATTLVWPVSCDGDYAGIARAQEQIILAQHLAELEHTPLPMVQTPLLELSDRQVLEVGHRLKTPFHLAWSCQSHALSPCRNCQGCRRRKAAFDALGLEDVWQAQAGAA